MDLDRWSLNHLRFAEGMIILSSDTNQFKEMFEGHIKKNGTQNEFKQGKNNFQ